MNSRFNSKHVIFGLVCTGGGIISALFGVLRTDLTLALIGGVSMGMSVGMIAFFWLDEEDEPPIKVIDVDLGDIIEPIEGPEPNEDVMKNGQ